MSKSKVENWQCKTCHLCMDKPFVNEHTQLTGHQIIIKTDPWEVVRQIQKQLGDIPK